MLVQRLSQSLNDFLSFIQICATQQVKHNAVSAEKRLAKGLWLAHTVEQFELLVRRRHNVRVALDHSAGELV